ncbi:MAG: phosphate acyltransferase PlsX [Rhizobiales bacterium]|nr:phosphate acyltransferase PlsX [Hyphomicrobiales bacterium]MBI3671881.1 phosphate acyltransferase PlsX [Hyphomicrobiales bacterium]
MAQQMTIALDAMGGDRGPEVVVPGAELSAIRHPGLHFALFGDRSRIAPLLDRHPKLKDRSSIHHTDVFVAMDAKPSQALRQGRGKSSMWQAIDAVRKGEAQAAVSAGNTGALMAMARFILKTLPGIQRPAIAAIWPTLRGDSVVLDVGATIGADASQLVEFAVMGEAMARCLLGLEKPTVGLLNVGVEEIKGVEQVKEAGRLLRQLHLPLEYVGFVEGDDIGKGTVDVVVTEGFTGNIALKAAEGTAKQISTYLKLSLSRTLISKLGAFLAAGAFRALKDRMDPRKHNGGVFLGLNGVVVKSHGGTDALGFATAVDVAIEMVRNDLVNKIKTDVVEMGQLKSPAQVPQLADGTR